MAPVAIAVACFALMLAPESVLPMPLTERVVWMAVLDYLLVSYHYAAQHFGLLSLYRARGTRVVVPRITGRHEIRRRSASSPAGYTRRQRLSSMLRPYVPAPPDCGRLNRRSRPTSAVRSCRGNFP